MSPRGALVVALLAGLAAICCPSRASAQLGCHVAMGNIQFGTVNDVGEGASTAAGAMNVYCNSASTPYVRVCIALGAPVANSWDPRYLQGPTPTRLEYNIYTDAGYTQIWGSAYGTAGKQRAVDMSTSWGNSSATVPYYAKVPAQNSVPPGQYQATFQYADDAAVRAVGYYGAPPPCTGTMPIVSRFEFSVFATVQADCSVSATTLDFGASGVGLATAPVNANSAITMTCAEGVNYSIALNAGQGSGATPADRKLTRSGGPETLLYRLYSDAARNRLWGDGSTGTSTVSGTGNGVQSPRTHLVYGTLAAQPPSRAGQYGDTITVTVTY